MQHVHQEVPTPDENGNPDQHRNDECWHVSSPLAGPFFAKASSLQPIAAFRSFLSVAMSNHLARDAMLGRANAIEIHTMRARNVWCDGNVVLCRPKGGTSCT